MVYVQRLLIPTLAISLLASCASTKEVDISVAPVERVHFDPPMPPPLVMQDEKWIVITPENAKAKFQEAINKGTNPAFMALDDESYEAKTENDAATLADNLRLRAIIQEFKDFYHNRDTEDAVSD